MILIDSSVWIDWLKGVDSEAVQFVREREGSEELALTQMIYLEVLQGVRSEAQFGQTQQVLGGQTMLEPMDFLGSYESAARLYRSARQRGLTIRKSTDCLIATVALENGALLVHNDRDFLALAAVEPKLQVFPRRAITPAH